MLITPLSIDPASLHLGDSGSIRAPGLHASDIYNSYYQDIEPERYKRGDGELPPPLLLETGIIIENMLEEGLKRRFEKSTGAEQIERPGEFIYEGEWHGRPFNLAYNPDLFIYNGVGLRVGEIKGTWLSSHIPHAWLSSAESIAEHSGDIEAAIHGNEKLSKYWCQVMMYAYMIRSRFGRLYACFIAGDYSRPFKSQLVAVDVEFSEDELEHNWGSLMNFAVGKGLI